MDKFKILDHMDKFITVVAIIVTGVFWIFTMNGIPARVTKLENEVETIKTQLSKNDTKTDIMLEDIKFIKQLNIHRD